MHFHGNIVQLFSHFSNHFILVKVAVDPEPILGMLGMRWEGTLCGTPVHHRAPPQPLPPPPQVVGNLENPEETHVCMERPNKQTNLNMSFVSLEK